MKIDLHCHAFPAPALRALARHFPDQVKLTEHADGRLTAVNEITSMRDFVENERIKELDGVGITVQVLSAPQIYMKLDQHLPEICRLVNDGFAESCRRCPDRFKAFAHLPFNDMNLAMAEMARALDQLGLAGIGITSSVGGHYFDEPQFEPFWAEANRRRVPVFMHPWLGGCYRDSERASVLSFPFDTTLAITRLISRGLYDRYPNVVIIASHLGGTLPFLIHRIDTGFNSRGAPDYSWKISRPPSDYVKKLYVDTAMSWSRAAFNCARDVFGIDRIVLGTDHFNPNGFLKRTVDFIDSLDLSAAQREMVYHHTAERILSNQG